MCFGFGLYILLLLVLFGYGWFCGLFANVSCWFETCIYVAYRLVVVG